MGRRAQIQFPLPDGRTVGASLKRRGDIWRVQFPHPMEHGKYVEATTGIRYGGKANTGQAEALRAAAKLVLKHYCPTLPPDVKRAKWDDVLSDLKETSQLRERSLAVYQSAVKLLRQYVETSGPGDITPDKAKQFRSGYAKGTWTRGKGDDAKQYKRGPKTVENALRRLSGLWSKYLRPSGYVTSNPWEDIERPTIPKKQPTAPTTADLAHFVQWIGTAYPGWTLLRAFIETKRIAVCRLADLCAAKSADLNPRDKTLTLHPSTDKTHRERVVLLPDDLFDTLNRIKGETWLWEQYTADSRTYRPGRRNRDTFDPKTWYWAVLDVFEKYNAAHPDRRPLKSHDLRRYGITQIARALGGNVDAAAELAGAHRETVKGHYLDAQQAFDLDTLRRKMIDVLRGDAPPQNDPK